MYSILSSTDISSTIEEWSNYFSTFIITYDESNNKYLSDVFHKRDFEQDTEFDDVKSKINKLKQFPHRLIAEAIGYSTHNPFYEYSFTIIYKCDLSFSLFNLFELIRKGEVVENYNNTSRYIILAGISRAMKYIYQINIGPQMLRPSSILLDNEFYPKIIPEFNMITYFFVPTMSYPPQLKDTIYLPNDDIEYEQEKTDVYAFAFIAYEILTGLNPCSFYSKYDHRSRKDEIRPKFNDSVSHDFNLSSKVAGLQIQKKDQLLRIFSSISLLMLTRKLIQVTLIMENLKIT